MIRALVLLCFFAAPALSAWSPGLKVRFDTTGFGSTSFMNVPRTLTEAMWQRWIPVVKPQLPAGLERLDLWCPGFDYAVCVFMDDIGKIAGLNFALDKAHFVNAFHDWESQGFTSWNVTENGVTSSFWTAQQYYISASTLATDPEIRIANRDNNTILQEDNIWVSGFDGKLYNISTTVSDFIDVEYTTQACIPLMGDHYYYNMSKTMPCGERSLLPWFPLVKTNQLIGLGFLTTGKITVPEGKTNWFENPSRAAVEMIVPNGPDCLYDLAGNYGVVTIHTYYISNPLAINCS